MRDARIAVSPSCGGASAFRGRSDHAELGGGIVQTTNLEAHFLLLKGGDEPGRD